MAVDSPQRIKDSYHRRDIQEIGDNAVPFARRAKQSAIEIITFGLLLSRRDTIGTLSDTENFQGLFQVQIEDERYSSLRR